MKFHKIKTGFLKIYKSTTDALYAIEARHHIINLVFVIIGGYVAYCLLIETRKQVCESQRANDITLKALEQNRINDSINDRRSDSVLAITRMTADAMIASNKIAFENLENSKTENTAFLNVDINGHVFQMGMPFKAMVYIENRGKTNAYNIRYDANIYLSEIDTPVFHFILPYYKSSLIEGEAIDMDIVSNHNITESQYQGIYNKTISVSLIGSFEYYDIYRVKCSKNFIFEFSPQKGMFMQIIQQDVSKYMKENYPQ